MKIVKRDGRVISYDRQKIVIAIQKANSEVEECERATEAEIESILEYIEGKDRPRMSVSYTHLDVYKRQVQKRKFQLQRLLLQKRSLQKRRLPKRKQKPLQSAPQKNLKKCKKHLRRNNPSDHFIHIHYYDCLLDTSRCV